MKSRSFLLPTLLLAISCCFSALTTWAQDGAAVNPTVYAETIKEADLEKHLTKLASDEFQGRETGTEGAKMAREYIVDQLKSFGIQPVASLNGYYQPVQYKRVGWGKVEAKTKKKEFRHMRDFYSFASICDDMPKFDVSEVIFLGYGIDDEKYSDYDGVNVKDKVLVMYTGEPTDEDEMYLITGTVAKSGWNFRRKLRTAKEKGAKLVLFIDPNTLKNINKFGRWLIEPSFELYDENAEAASSRFANHMFVSPTMIKGILGRRYKKIAKTVAKIRKTGKPHNFVAKTKLTVQMNKKSEILESPNILGFIEGTDEDLKDEVVVVSAHYDHLGKRGDDVFNGADDNGSGTTGLVELAQAFAQAKKDGAGPRRSVLFLWVAGEEKGLLGSEYYSKHPVFPLENTVADVNVDMIGRVDDRYGDDDPNYIYVIGSDRLSTDLHKINEEANQKYVNLTLDYKYNDEADPNRYYYRSDHYNFAKNGIPSIFYFNGTHDDYHKQTDTVEKINFAKMQKIVKLIFYTSWELANRDERIKVDVPQED